MVLMHITSASVLDIERRDNPSKHYVYVILLHVSDTSRRFIFRRYNDFFELQMKLLEKFPEAAGKDESHTRRQSRSLPFIPGKILFGRSQIREVAMERRPLLNEYLKALLLMNEEISRSAPVEEFLRATPEDAEASRQPRASERRNSADNVEISEPTAMPRAKVIRDHVKGNSKEVTVNVGQVVEVLEKFSNGWSKVRADLQWGFMPSVCLELEAGSAVRCSQSSEEEEGGLFVVSKAISQPALSLASIVTVTEVLDDGWWRVLNSTERVPAVCLRPLRSELQDLLIRRHSRPSQAEEDPTCSLDPSPQRISAPARSFTPTTGRRAAPAPPRPPHSPGNSPRSAPAPPRPPHSPGNSPRSASPKPPPPAVKAAAPKAPSEMKEIDRKLRDSATEVPAERAGWLIDSEVGIAKSALALSTFFVTAL